MWEERRARPEWGREMDITFAHALNEGKVMKLDVLNQGFQDPKMISLAYYQASLVVEHIVETYGEPKLHALLRAYGEGLEDETAIKEGLGVSLAQLQTGFDARLEKQYAGLRRALKTPEMKEKMSVDDLKALAASNPDSFAVQMRLALALQEAKDSAGAIAALERASQIIPSANGANNPHTMIAKIALEQKDTARAIKALETVMRVDHSDVESARKLAELVSPARRRRTRRGCLSPAGGDRSLRRERRSPARASGAQAQGRGDRRALVQERPRLESARPRAGARRAR